MAFVGDNYIINVAGTDYTNNTAAGLDITKTPDTLSRTCSLDLRELADYDLSSSDAHVGAEVRVRGQREDRQSAADVAVLFRGIVLDKVVPEIGGITEQCILNCVDHLYRITRQYCNLSVTSPTFSQELRAYFTSDGSGAGAPTEYVRKAVLKIDDGVNPPYIPSEDMDKLPYHSFRRKKDDEYSVYIQYSEVQMLHNRKEVVITNAQVDSDLTPTALPGDYESSVPNPPNGAGANQGWTYRMIASFFVNPTYPNRNINDDTVERVLRDVLATSPDGEAGGGGYAFAMLNLTYPYAKGAGVSIPDRIDEGMRVTAISGSDITVEDGNAWTGKTTLTYTDTQGVAVTRTISGIVANVITVTVAPTNLLVGMFVHGCDQLGIIVTLTAGDTTEINNYTDITIGGTSYFIREVRDSTTLVIVNVAGTDDFSGLAATGDIIYPTIEYTGQQIKRFNWDKTDGSIADMIADLRDRDLININYEIDHIPWLQGTANLETHCIRGRSEKQYNRTVNGAPAGLVVTMNTPGGVDGFLPLRWVVWLDGSTYRSAQITAVDYDLETLTLTSVTGIVNGTTLYADATISGKPYRLKGGELTLSLERAYKRCEVFSQANQVYPALNSASTSVLEPPPSNSGIVGTWSVVTGGADEMADNSISSMYLLRWQAKKSGQLEGDPEQYNMTPIPWPVCSWDATGGGLEEFEKVLLQVAYTEKNPLHLLITDDKAIELPMFTVQASIQDVALGSVTEWSACCSELVARQFDPRNPNSGTFSFDVDLIQNFRHIRLLCDRPFFYKEGETNFGVPVRNRDVPVMTFQVYKRNDIKYTANDETLSQDQLSPTGQITPYIGQRPFVSKTNKGGTISNIAALVLTIGSGHNFAINDTLEFYDTSADVPFSGTNSSTTVTGVGATTVTVAAVPAGLANGDKVGGLRRWVLDALDVWRDFYAPNSIADVFENVTPSYIIEDETPQNGWDAQKLAALRLYEADLGVRDGNISCLWDPHVRLYQQIVGSNIFAPVKVMGISFSGFGQTVNGRDFNSTLESKLV